MSAREPLRERMAGRWHGVLPMLGVSESFLKNKHGPCPDCGGRDRFRFDDKDGTGSWICSHCGAGDGVSLVMRVNRWDFKTAAQRIEQLSGTVEPQAQKPKPDPRKLHQAMRDTWARGGPIGDVVRGYLLGRGIDVDGLCDIRESPRGEMFALVRDANGQGCQVHRTRLTAGKVDCRLFMPGPIPEGAAVRLLPAGETLGIAEGIETALSAAILFDIPVWAALNTSLLKKWSPPAEVKRVVVFGDSDGKFAGQAAAYELARRLSTTVEVTVEIPKSVGTDWNDVLQARAAQRQTA